MTNMNNTRPVIMCQYLYHTPKIVRCRFKPKQKPVLPPEILRIVATYMDRHVLLALSMTNRYCARLFTGLYHNNWEVDCCCCTFQEAAMSESHDIYNFINMDLFFRALKDGFAPAYAKKVHFYFWRHFDLLYEAESCSKKCLQRWPLDQTAKYLKLLNASEIVVTITDHYYLGSICNARFLRDLLCSVCALPNAVVKLRGDLGRTTAQWIHPGSFYFTIRDSSTSQAAVADNLLRALSQICPSSIDYGFWDGLDLYSICPATSIRGIYYPNVTDLRFSRNHVSEDSITKDFVSRPEEYLEAFPLCQRLTCRWESVDHYGCLETTFFFDNVPAQGRKCTKVLVHNELSNWVKEILTHGVDLRHVRVLEFHHSQYEALVKEGWYSYTPATLNVLLGFLLLCFPNLERMVLNFGTVIAGPNHPGTLRKGYCEHCKLGVNVLEFDIRTMLSEFRLITARHRSVAKLIENTPLVRSVSPEFMFEVEFDVEARLKSIARPRFLYVIYLSELGECIIRLESRSKPVYPHAVDRWGLEAARKLRSKLSGLLKACRRLKTRVRRRFQRIE